MWFFRSPQITFGEDALSQLDLLQAKRVFIVTDTTMRSLGHLQKIQDRLEANKIESAYFDRVEPDPCIETVRACAAAMCAFAPDWIIGLGGGSCMDAAKAAWFLYERPDVDLEAINPVENFGLRAKARFLTVPTTAGSGSEVSQAALISDSEARRKLELASYEMIADITIVDPQFSAHMPRQLTADTGIDVLAHAVEAYNNNWSNDFTDGLSLQAAWMVFNYLPRAVALGAEDAVAREKMANAATIAGLVITNSNISLAHALGHSAGALFHLVHGRVTAICLPLTLEFYALGGVGRYLSMARLLGLCTDNEKMAALSLAQSIRELMRTINLPLTLEEAGVPRQTFEQDLDALCDRAEMDLGLVMAPRIPDRSELQRLFEYAYEGRVVDF